MIELTLSYGIFSCGHVGGSGSFRESCRSLTNQQASHSRATTERALEKPIEDVYRGADEPRYDSWA